MAHNLAKGQPQLEAYKAAGFGGQAKTSANAVAMRPDVKARVQEIIATQHKVEIRSTERAIEKASIDKEWCISRLKYIVEFGIRGRPMLDDKGADTGKYIVKPDLRSAGGALRTLTQMGGWLVNQHEIGAPGDFARLSDKELDGELIEVGKAIGLSDKELLRITNGSSE